MNKNKKSMLHILSITEGCFVLLNLFWILQKDNLIVSLGIRSYKTLRSFFLLCFCISTLVLILVIILKRYFLKKDEKNVIIVQEKAPPLSIKDKLDSTYLRKMLKNEASGRWRDISEELYVTIQQLDQMDIYQDRLHNLLEENDVNALSDTEEILDQSEQYLCQNARRILNYLSVFEQKDTDAVKTIINNSNDKNQQQLDQVKEFIFAITDFVNQQGGTALDPDIINTYKDIIVNCMQGE